MVDLLDSAWLATTGRAALMVALSVVGIYASLILFTRIAGLRSFSKMSGFDFAVTVAIGSLISTTILTPDPPLALAIFALGMLFVLQITVAALRAHGWLGRLTDNEPMVVLWKGEVIEENLRRVKMTRSDLLAKLREANALDPDAIHAVVMETTGDVSVLHGGEAFDLLLVEGVRGVPEA